VVLAPEEAAPTAAAEVKPDHQDHLETLDAQETPEHQAAQATQDAHPLKFANRPLHHLATLAQLDRQDHQEPPALQEMLDQTANPDKEAAALNQDPLDHQDHQDHLVSQETQEPQDNPDSQPSPKKPDQDSQAQLETPDHQDHQAQLDSQDSQEAQEPQDRKDLQETPELQETTVSQVIQAKPATQEAPARRVFARNTAPWTAVSSSRTELVAVKRPLVLSSGDLLPPETCPMICPFLLVDQKTAIYYVFLLWTIGVFGVS